MATYKLDEIIPIEQLGIDMSDPFEVYSWNPKLEGDPEEAKAIAIYNLAMKDYNPRQNSQGRNNLTTAGVIEAVMPAVTEYFIDPLFFEDKAKALSLYRDMVVNIINHYVQDINDNRSNKGKKKLEMVSNIGLDALVETLFGFYHIINLATCESNESQGVLLALSKDEERDPEATFISMDQLLPKYMSMVPTEKHTKENLKRIKARIKSDPRTIVHITEAAVEGDKTKEIVDVVPCNNGIYIKKHFEDTGKMLSYRDAFKKEMYVPFAFAANYLGPDNPPPVIKDEYGEFDPKTLCENLYYKVNGKIDPAREKQFWAMVLSCFRVYDNSYGKGHFFMDDGLGSTGKSTLAKYIRRAIGLTHCAKLSLTQIEAGNNNTYALAPLRDPSICHIYSDENEPDDWHDNMANLKELITGDPITASQKYEDDATVIFKGRMIQNINNGVIKSKDNGGSLYRRINGLKFKFRVDPGDGTGGEVIDNPKIKNDYIERQSWIDWLLTEAINRNELKLPLTDESKAIRDTMEERNNKILRFFNSRVNTMQQNWFRLDYLWPAFQVFLTEEKFNDRMTYTTFEDEAKKIIARRDSQWTYEPESESKPDTPKAKKVDGITVPLTGGYNPMKHEDRHIYDLKYDEIYRALMEVAKPGNHRYEEHVTKAKEALEKMYREKRPGTLRGVYFRKDKAEISMLENLADMIVTGHIYDVPADVIYKTLEDGYLMNAPGKFGTGDIELEKIDDKQEQDLRDHIVKRFKKLQYVPEVM